MTDKAVIAECENCSRRGAMHSRYMRFSREADMWYQHLFCDGKCCAEWLRLRNRLPNTGITVT